MVGYGGGGVFGRDRIVLSGVLCNFCVDVCFLEVNMLLFCDMV